MILDIISVINFNKIYLVFKIEDFITSFKERFKKVINKEIVGIERNIKK